MGKLRIDLRNSFKDGGERSMSDFGHGTHLRVLRGMIIWSNIYLMSLGAKVIFYEYNLNIETTEYRNSHPLKKKERNSHPDSLYPTKKSVG